MSTDGRCRKSNRSARSSSKIEREVVSITLVHHFETKVSTVQDVSPGVDDTTAAIEQRLVEVETVEVECHGANTKGNLEMCKLIFP